MVDQDAAHHARGHRHEMRAIVQVDGGGVHQAKIHLMHERRRLHGVVAALRRQ
jgi:hypothetical protein